MSDELNIAMIGAGFMGRSHSAALAAYPVLVPDGGYRPVLDVVADATDDLAARARQQLGFRRSTADWRAAVTDPAVDVVDIVVPNVMHFDVAMAALEAGKHVTCEKPLTLTLEQAATLAEAAARSDVVHQVGFNWRLTPAVQQARRLIADGALGEIRSVRCFWQGEFFADPAIPRLWRFERAQAGSGALGDLGSHAIDFARFLAGDIESVCGLQRTYVPDRPAAEGSRETLPVEVDDMSAFLVEFAGGATGYVECSWAFPGRKTHAGFEVHGSEGSVLFDWERMNEFRLYEAGAPEDRQGYKTVLVGPAHPGAGLFCPGAGYQMGYLETKVLQFKDLFDTLAGKNPRPQTDFIDGYECMRVEHAVELSAARRAWQLVEDSR